MAMAPRSLLRHLVRSDRGVALVEFAFALPLLIMLFAVIIEGGRMMWSYQTAVAEVRNAARYVGRVVHSDICTSGKTVADYVSVSDLATHLSGVLPTQVQLDTTVPPGVTVTRTCVAGSFRLASTPIATVSAKVRINLPFEGLFDIVGLGMAPYLVTTITDNTRVFGS